ncbi:MAG: phosphoglucosamine mutase, partial [Gammaproteobacteria bacterium]|nr:phosphoglucosamine mutase [Gammaproteobacteria bacterium]
TTGDGIVSALQVVDIMNQTGISLADLRKGMTQYPQLMINVKADREKQVWNDKTVRKAVRDAEQKLAEKGRVLLRPSGTEPLVRVMVEGENEDLVNTCCQDIAQEVESAAAK